jgi:type II secretory pathway component GspD/PulD (secretin)
MDVPVLGRIFRVDTDRVDRTEIIILITPHVIRNRKEARSVTEEFEERIQGLKALLGRIQKPKVRLQVEEPTVQTPERPAQPSPPDKSEAR